MTGYDSRDTTSLNLDPTNTYNDLNKPYENLRIGVVDEFNIDALSKESQKLFNESLKVFESLGASITRFLYQTLINQYLHIMSLPCRMFFKSFQI